MPNFSITEAIATAERIRAAVEVLEPFGETIYVTTSIGVAASTGELATAEALYKAADEAMYVSKFTTKNRVTAWPPSDEDRELAALNRTRRVTRN